MTAVPLFDHHHGCHCAPPSVLVMFFRRVLRLPWRKPAAPADLGAAGAATPPDGLPVMRDRTISEVRREHDLLTDADIAALRTRKVLPRADGDILIDERNGVHVRPVNGRLLGDLPRREPMRREPGQPPWRTAELPVYGQACVATMLAAEREGRLIA